MTVAFETAHDIEQQIRQAIAACHSRRWQANRWAWYVCLGCGNRDREVDLGTDRSVDHLPPFVNPPLGTRARPPSIRKHV